MEFESPIREIDNNIADLKKSTDINKGVDFSIEISELEKQKDFIMDTIYKNLTSWQIVQVARHPRRPLFQDYLGGIFEDFIELHGDRLFGDDHSIVAGFARLGDIKFAVIGQEKGKDTKEKIFRNFGMPNPEGYRKALRVMKMAEKFNLPLLTFVDTNGAYPGIESEERGQGEAIARNLFEMSSLKIPIISTVIGEGGSGGALALAVADRVLMLENAIYSVITPEGCATILYRDVAKVELAAKVLKFTSKDLYEFGVIEEIIPEPKGGAHRDMKETLCRVRESVLRNYNEIRKIPPGKFPQKRYERFRKLGVYDTL
ncbi:MAG: acetyl-CoA carboxylase carboxyltransferase subunit alpha [Brevinematales bacterium]